MKILHIISSGGMYGAEAVILDLSRGLRERGHTSLLGVFASTPDDDTEFRRRARSIDLSTHPILCRGQLDRTVPRQILNLVQRSGADVVHAHGYKADVYAYWALRGSGIPAVSTCHTWYDNDLALRLYGMIDRLVLRRFAAVVAVSREVRASLASAGVAQDRIFTIRNGISADAFATAQRSVRLAREGEIPAHDIPTVGIPTVGIPTVGLVGRLAPEKGVDLFLRAAALVREQIPTVRFLVAGDGPDRAVLEALRVELGLESSATLLGRHEDMPGFFASLDLLVSASRQEGLPIALLEGMASGLPVVATRVGEVPEVVESGRTGLLVEAGQPEALAAAIIQMLGDPERRMGMGMRARTRVQEEFSAQRMTSDYLRVYEGVTKAGSR